MTAELRRLKAEAVEKGVEGAKVGCEIQVAGELGYAFLAAALISAAQADVKTVRLTTDGKEFVTSEMPTIDRGGALPGVVVKQAWLKMGRRGEETVVGVFDATAAPVGKELKAFLADQEKALGEDVQVIVQAAEDVPSADVIKVYGMCVEAGFKRVFFAPAGAKTMAVEGGGVKTIEAGGARGIVVKGFGVQASAKKVVYVVDGSAAVEKDFEAIKAEIRRAVSEMSPVQSFDVVVLGETVEAVLGGMQRATTENKKTFGAKMDAVKAGGAIAGKLEPFKEGFEKAFSMKPEVIYFLSGSDFDEKLLEAVAELNKDRKVRVNAIVYGAMEEKGTGRMKQMAKGNGGMFKQVTREEGTGR